MGCCGGVAVVVEDVGGGAVVGWDFEDEDHGCCCEGDLGGECFALVAGYG